MTKNDKIKKILKPEAEFTIQNRTYCFIPGDRKPKQTAGTGLLGKTQSILKKNGKLYYKLLNLLGPVLPSNFYNEKLQYLLDKYSQEKIIINTGSGPTHIANRKDIINIDVFAFDEVDIVADAYDLPIEDSTVDFIINVAMMEHVETPNNVVQEMHRILKPGGEIFVYTPFMVPYHAAPHDYFRWNHQGLKKLLEPFENVQSFIGAGPSSGMSYVLTEWLALLFSFGAKTLHDILFIFFMTILSPLKYFDFYLNRFELSQNIASGFFATARKSLPHN